MAGIKNRNPLAFKPIPVSIIIVITYVALFAGLLYVHHVVPSAPHGKRAVEGVDINEAWRDLAKLTEAYHPYNSHQNDIVRSWLLERVEQILKDNNVEFDVEPAAPEKTLRNATAQKTVPVTIFNDMISNTTFARDNIQTSVYFEGTNIIVYIRGSEDGDSDWWRDSVRSSLHESAQKDNTRGVLVNAHYDSVSTGFGATDDGVGVISILQLIKYYTTEGQKPKRGIVLLLNNGEEDFLNGAHAFVQHPISKFPDTFLNLEGAGAGGRATLFRSTDAEVTKHYGNSPYPFGTVISDDGFKRGVIISETDYVVFHGALGLRGLDVAFMEPRARYHTSGDSAKRTSENSLWHMLSAAIATTKSLTDDTNTHYEPGEGSRGVWFDLFGRTFGLATAESFFAVAVVLLVISPLAMFGTLFLLYKSDKMYIFCRKAHSNSLDPQSTDEEVIVHISGWRGIFRYPVAFGLASAAAVGLAFLVAKENPYIVYSSRYAVWTMLLTAWFVVAWFFLRGADFMRPTALQRAHSLGWLLIICWILLVAATAGLRNFEVSGGYFVVIYYAGVFVAAIISYLELFGLLKKKEYVQIASRIGSNSGSNTHRRASMGSSQLLASDTDDRPGSSDRQRYRDEAEPTERTGLLTGSKFKKRTFGKYSAPRRIEEDEEFDESETQAQNKLRIPYGEEQSWSGHLPTWLWVIEFLVLAPISIILVGQIGLLAVSALYQTSADGSAVLTVHLCMAIFTILLLMPLSPFLHRFSSRIPTLLFLIFIGTLIYNLLAFPFSEQNRLKVYFDQKIDLDARTNRVTLTGLEGYVKDIVQSLPSASGQDIECRKETGPAAREGLLSCSWKGLAPNVAPTLFADVHHKHKKPIPPEKGYTKLVTFNATRINGTSNEAEIYLVGKNTRGCKLQFDIPIIDFKVKGASKPINEPTGKLPKDGAKEIRLWSRDWERGWKVYVKWDADREENESKDKARGLDGSVVCIWSDANDPGVIPALDEVKKFMPIWSTVTKMSDGLVEGKKRFMI